VYSVGEAESFNRVDLLKKFLDRQFGKEKKEVSEFGMVQGISM
jgi:hypothetical protein